MLFHTLAIQAPAQPNDIANFVRLAATVIVALAAAGTFIIALRARKTVQQIHVLVNSKMTAALEQIETLTAALEVQTHLPAVPAEKGEGTSPGTGQRVV